MICSVLVYALGCALTGVYALRNLYPEEIGDYYKSAVVVTSLIWPILIVAVIVVGSYTVLRKLYYK